MNRSSNAQLDSNCKTYKQYVLKTVDAECPFKKKSKYDYEYYYDMMNIVLKDVVSWRSLKVTKNYIDKKENHHTTIRKMFNKWSSYGIFEKAYMNMLKDRVMRQIQKDRGSIDLFIDSTFIDNKTGSEMVGINPINYKKRVSKLSIICDKNKNILTVKPFKSTINDCLTVEDTLKDMNISKRINLIGDKGYLVREEIIERLRERKVRLVIPRKKNQKKRRLKKSDKERLKERNKVENCIKMIKSYDRIRLRKDKKIINYMSFVYMGCGIIMERNNMK